MIKVSDYIFKSLVENSTARTVFLLPGGGCMHLVDSLGRNQQLQYVCTLHEQAAVIAAEAYAQFTGDIGVALVTAGPGSTNAITGLAGAWIDSTPLLILSGQAKTSDLHHRFGVRQMGIQEVDTCAIVSPLCKYAKCLLDPSKIRYELEKALYLARHGRKGPVWLDIPLDIQAAEIDPEKLESFVPPAPVEADYNAAADEILKALAQAKRPVIYAGNGIRQAGALPLFRKLLGQCPVPVLTSWKAADFLSEDHPLFVGRPGIVPQRAANLIQQSSDCLLALGTRLDLCQTGFRHDHFAPQAKKYVVDIDPCELAKLDMKLSGAFALDAGLLLQALLSKISNYPVECSQWLAHCKNLQRRYPVFQEEYRHPAGSGVHLYHLIEELSSQLGADDILVPGSSGACAEVTLQAFKITAGQRLLNTPGLGSMGFGLPASIGAAIAAGGNKKITSLIGDGGLQHNIQELQTLANLQLPVRLFVLNNNGYGSIYQMQKNRFGGLFVACHPESGLSLPSLQAIAQAYALPWKKISSTDDLHTVLPEVLHTRGPVICEVIMCENQQTSPRLASEMRPDGQMISRPMEDVYPFLPPDELQDCLKEK